MFHTVKPHRRNDGERLWELKSSLHTADTGDGLGLCKLLLNSSLQSSQSHVGSWGVPYNQQQEQAMKISKTQHLGYKAQYRANSWEEHCAKCSLQELSLQLWFLKIYVNFHQYFTDGESGCEFYENTPQGIVLMYVTRCFCLLYPIWVRSWNSFSWDVRVVRQLEVFHVVSPWHTEFPEVEFPLEIIQNNAVIKGE